MRSCHRLAPDGSPRTGFCGTGGEAGHSQPTDQHASSRESVHRPHVTDQPAMVRIGCGSDFLVRYGPSTAAPNGLFSSWRATALTSSRVTSSISASVCVDAAVLAVVQLAAADAVHPRAGVLEAEHQPAAQRSLGDSALGLGDAVARHRLRARRWSPGPPRRTARAGTRHRPRAHRCRRTCPPSNTPSRPARAFPESLGTAANSGRRRARC